MELKGIGEATAFSNLAPGDVFLVKARAPGNGSLCVKAISADGEQSFVILDYPEGPTPFNAGVISHDDDVFPLRDVSIYPDLKIIRRDDANAARPGDLILTGDGFYFATYHGMFLETRNGSLKRELPTITAVIIIPSWQLIQEFGDWHQLLFERGVEAPGSVT